MTKYYIKAKYKARQPAGEQWILVRRNDDQYRFVREGSYESWYKEYSETLPMTGDSACRFWMDWAKEFIKEVEAGKIDPFYTAGSLGTLEMKMDLPLSSKPICTCPTSNFAWNGVGCCCGAFQHEKKLQKSNQTTSM